MLFLSLSLLLSFFSFCVVAYCLEVVVVIAVIVVVAAVVAVIAVMLLLLLWVLLMMMLLLLLLWWVLLMLLLLLLCGLRVLGVCASSDVVVWYSTGSGTMFHCNNEVLPQLIEEKLCYNKHNNKQQQ